MLLPLLVLVLSWYNCQHYCSHPSCKTGIVRLRHAALLLLQGGDTFRGRYELPKDAELYGPVDDRVFSLFSHPTEVKSHGGGGWLTYCSVWDLSSSIGPSKV